MSMKITIAIDGYSACGKSTLAKALAKALDYSFIDSGAMYRGAALFFQRLGYVSEKHIDRAAIDMAIPDLELSFKIHNGKNCLYLRDENIEDEQPKPEEEVPPDVIEEEPAEIQEPDPVPDTIPEPETELELEQEPEAEQPTSDQPEVDPEPEES